VSHKLVRVNPGVPLLVNPHLPGLVDPYLKLGRAEMHLKALDLLLKEFTGDKAYTLRRYEDLEQQRYCLECKLLDVPDPICLTVGDVCYNMRSCLDQLVWSLAKRLGGVLDPDRTQFPIMEIDNSASRKRFRQQTDGVPDAPTAEILAFQPYHRGSAYKAHPLWRLDALCNLDKHRRIPANGGEMNVTFPNITQGDVVGIQPTGRGVVVEVPLGFQIEALNDRYVMSVPLSRKSKLHLNPSITFQVNFGQGDAARPDKFTVAENIMGLWEIHYFIANTLLPRFVRFFP
jgi:hypothetical protein